MVISSYHMFSLLFVVAVVVVIVFVCFELMNSNHLSLILVFLRMYRETRILLPS